MQAIREAWSSPCAHGPDQPDRVDDGAKRKHLALVIRPANVRAGLGGQCPEFLRFDVGAHLDRRIDTADTLTREVAAWEAQRNAAKAKVNWRLNTDDAQIRLKKLYLSFEV